MVQILDFSYILYIFTSPSAQDREVSQLRENFSSKSPSRMTPGGCSLEAPRQGTSNEYTQHMFYVRRFYCIPTKYAFMQKLRLAKQS